ncbi:TRAP transporter substrate-binding protein [Microbulbifer sp. S227A]|uniref:TRAP transporter substrate-binding protein n=1 Tax=Microbulbifer sp. S227A TaxID=3415131 RepID=UPI003C7ED2D2
MNNLSTAIATLSLAIGLSTAAQAEVWKMQTLWPAGSPNQMIVEDFAKRLTIATGGDIEMQLFAVQSVVPFTETLEAVGKGILQAHHSGGVYFAGKDPALALVGELSGAYESPYQMSNWFYYEGGLELAREAYAPFNAYYVGPVFWGMEALPSKEPLRGIADFEGKKIRTTSGVASELMTRLGAAPVTMSGAEIFSALDKGVIDIADWGTLGMNEALGLHSIVKYETYPGFFQLPAADVVVNLDAWNALSDENKAILEMAVRTLNYDMIAQLQLQDAEAVAKAAENGVELIDWSQEERNKFRAIAAEVWQEYGQKNELAGRIYESHMAYLAKLGLL